MKRSVGWERGKGHQSTHAHVYATNNTRAEKRGREDSFVAVKRRLSSTHIPPNARIKEDIIDEPRERVRKQRGEIIIWVNLKRN